MYVRLNIIINIIIIINISSSNNLFFVLTNWTDELLIIAYLLQDPNTGKENVSFTFQKMRYTYDCEEKKRFEAIQYPIDWTFKQYCEWKGYQEDDDLKAAETKYGVNRLVHEAVLYYSRKTGMAKACNDLITHT